MVSLIVSETNISNITILYSTVTLSGKGEREVSVWQRYRGGGIYADKVLDVF